MNHVKLIRDPLYLSQQPVTNIPEHQVSGLLNHIRALILLCKKEERLAMCAPEAGLHYNFFVARSPDPRQPDFDTVFESTLEPFESEGRRWVEEHGVDGVLYRVPRWRKMKMRWKYHNGQSFENMVQDIEGDVCYMAQTMCDRLAGIYLGASDDDIEVEVGK